ncbi:MAG: Npun_F0494 family protein [Cyanobium sp.]
MASALLSPDPHALRRARQAVRCLPFRLRFYRELDGGALSSSQLAARQDWPALSRRRLTPNRIEDHLIWLIQLGVLRREVDGQGLTERVRLTPLGRDTIAPWSKAIPPAGPLMQLRHWLRRQRPRL